VKSLSANDAPGQLSAPALYEVPAVEPLPGARFRWSLYFLHLAGIPLFFGAGLFLTLRSFLRRRVFRMEIDAGRSREELARGFAWYFGFLQRQGGLILDLSDLESLRQERGVILAANHPCLFDAMVILSALPQTTCVMRASLMRNPALRGGATGGGFIPNDCGADFIRLAVEKLGRGESLLIFPEGTRTDAGRLLNEFKGGTALVAIKAGAPVQLLLIEYTGTQLRKGVPLWQSGRYPVLLRIRRGPRLMPADGERPHALTARLRESFLTSLRPGGVWKDPPSA
jgi:1-acyl-sn-glycerol-3-phosphate acyltransferase